MRAGFKGRNIALFTLNDLKTITVKTVIIFYKKNNHVETQYPRRTRLSLLNESFPALPNRIPKQQKELKILVHHIMSNQNN
jgi:hypothetical protein